MKHLRGTRGLITKPATIPLVLLLALAAGAPLTACVGDQEESSGIEQLGSLGLSLEVAPGVTLLSVTYSITGNGFTKTGTIDVSDSPTISGTIGGIVAGNGYTLELSATSAPDETAYSGAATFNVVAGQTTAVAIHLTGTSGADSGSVSVTGTINVGPVIDELSALPLTAFVDHQVTLTAVANDVDGQPSPLSYSWSASAGNVGSPTEATTTLSSATPGTVTVTLTVSDGELTSARTSTVTFVDPEEDDGAGGEAGTGGGVGAGGAPGTGGAADTGGATGSGGAAGTGGEASTGGATGTGGGTSGGTTGTGGEASTGGATGTGETGAEQQGPLTLVTTAVAPNTAGVTSAVVPIPSGVRPGDIAVVFVLSTGSAAVVGSPQGFVTTSLAAAQHNLSYGPIGDQSSLTWTSAATATTGATAYFFRGANIAVEVLATNQPSGNTFGLAASTQAPQAAFASGYALFGIQLPVSSTPTVTVGPLAPWVGPVSDGRQLLTWGQLYVPATGGFVFPSSLGGTLSASSVKRQAHVFVSSPTE